MGWEGNHPKGEKLSEMARLRAKEKNLPFAAALLEVAREHPLLASEARFEALNTKGYDHRPDVAGTEKAIIEMAKRRGFEKNISFALALSEVKRELPELAQAYREAVLGVKLS